MSEMPLELSGTGVPGAASPEFRRLARAGRGASPEGVYRECGLMTSAEWRAAANTALDALVGYRAARP
ncbi:hypothetical protein [Kitasatospora sp. NPDC004272]